MKRYLLGSLVIFAAISSIGTAEMVRELWSTAPIPGESLAAIRDFHADKRPGMELNPAPDLVDILPDSVWDSALPGDPVFTCNMWGWVTVPETGTYTWHVHADNHAILYISPDENMENAVEVATITGWSNVGEWNGGADGGTDADSEPFSYSAGQQLAVWGIMVEGTGGDNMGIGWTRPAAGGITYLGDAISILPPTPTKAKDPDPAVDVNDISRDMTLAWEPGKFAATHNVYFGTNLTDVNDRAPGTLVGDGITEATFDPGRLEFGETYYWGVDEVNAPPDSTVYAGKVWSFTVEAEFVPIASNDIQVTASSTFGVSGPEQTVNHSGLVDDLHGSNAEDMWISGGIPATIEYAFDRAYKLQELWIWNSNQLIESFVGFGAKDVVIEHSLDGENWTVLEGVGPLAQATGLPGYAANNMIDFGGAMVQHVSVTINSVQGIAPQASLSEVRFFYVPVFARGPQPADGATIDGVDAALSWRSGREAGRHEVYLDMETATTLVATLDENSYLATALELESTYQWKIDEANDAESPALHEGDTWSFSTPASLSVDDMESYADAEFLEIWATWVDGFDDPANGSLVGNGASGTPETGIVHAGGQSLPLDFGNGGAAVSEATRTFDQAQDWTRSGIQSLVLYFRPGADNTGGGVYVKINDTKIVHEAAGGLPPGWDAWTQWTIDLSTVADASSVRSMTIGVEGAGVTGVIYVDSIQLFKNAPIAFQPLSWFEAEAADVMGASWRVVDDPTASGGNRIGSEAGDGDDNDTAPGAEWVAAYTFTVPADGVYGLALRAQEVGFDSFWVRIVGATSQSHEDPDQPDTGWVRFNEIDAPSGWTWDEVHSNDHGNAVVSWTLPAGPLTLEIAKREAGVYLDAIALMK